MTSTIPPAYDYRPGGDVERLIDGEHINDAGTDAARDRPHNLYARMNRRHLVHRTWVTQLQWSADASAHDVPLDAYTRISTDREDVYVEGYGEDAIVVVTFKTTGGTTIDTATLTFAAGSPTYQVDTATITSTAFVVTATIQRQSTAAKLWQLRVIEDELAPSDLPS